MGRIFINKKGAGKALLYFCAGIGGIFYKYMDNWERLLTKL